MCLAMAAPAVGPKPGSDVDHAGGKAGFDDEFADAQCAERRLLGGLEDDRVAGRQRRAEFPRLHEQREIPRDDLAETPTGSWRV